MAKRVSSEESGSTGSEIEGAEREAQTPVIAGAVAKREPTQGELIQVDHEVASSLQGIADILGLLGGPVVDNFPANPVERWRLDNLATTGASQQLGDLVGVTIEPVYWRIEAVEITDPQNGEVSKAPRVVLFDRQGKVYHACSLGIFQVVSSFARVFGRKPLPEGFQLKVAQIKTRLGFKMLTLQSV